MSLSSSDHSSASSSDPHHQPLDIIHEEQPTSSSSSAAGGAPPGFRSATRTREQDAQAQEGRRRAAERRLSAVHSFILSRLPSGAAKNKFLDDLIDFQTKPPPPSTSATAKDEKRKQSKAEAELSEWAKRRKSSVMDSDQRRDSVRKVKNGVTPMHGTMFISFHDTFFLN